MDHGAGQRKKRSTGGRLEALGRMSFLTHLVLGLGQCYLPQMRKLRLKKQGAAQGSAAVGEPRKQLVGRAEFFT